MNTKISLIVSMLILLMAGEMNIRAQGAAVAPSRVYFDASVGESQSKIMRVTNTASVKQAFTVTFSDFEAIGSLGKTQQLDLGSSLHSIGQWLTASPSFFELEPGVVQEVKLILSVPNVPEANEVKWGSVLVKLAKEQKDALDKEGNKMGFGIMETFQFVLFAFQTPPTITEKSAYIVDFKLIKDIENSKQELKVDIANTGRSIVNCASYIDITNMGNGKNQRLKAKAFTMLPDTKREMNFLIPADIEAGNYTALAVVDYGSREDIAAAEMEFVIK